MTRARRLEQVEGRAERRLLVRVQVVLDGPAGALGGDDIKNDGGLPGLGAPSAWQERVARGTPKVRTSHRCVRCVFVWTPSRAGSVCSERLDLNM